MNTSFKALLTKNSQPKQRKGGALDLGKAGLNH